MYMNDTTMSTQKDKDELMKRIGSLFRILGLEVVSCKRKDSTLYDRQNCRKVKRPDSVDP